MHVGRGKTTTFLIKIVTFTTKNCCIYNRCKSAGCRNAIHPKQINKGQIGQEVIVLDPVQTGYPALNLDKIRELCEGTYLIRKAKALVS